jgi:RNA polymerase sigma factor (sigma-70 family)
LQEAIDQSLNPREAALIYATLKGETPAEIAQQWGVAPKTVSNEKTRAIQKLREALVAELAD